MFVSAEIVVGGAVGAVVVLTDGTETVVTGFEGCAITPLDWDRLTVDSVAELTAPPPATETSSFAAKMLEVVASFVVIEVVELEVVVGSLLVVEEILVCTTTEG